MHALILLPLCVALGFALRKRRVVGPGGAAAVGTWVVYVALPALILQKLPALTLDGATLALALVPWGVFGGLAAVLWAVRRPLHLDGGQRGALLLTVGLGNTSFVGLPLLGALLGGSALGPALAADQGGTFLALSLAGLPAGLLLAGQPVGVGVVMRRLLLFPPFVAALVAFGLRVWPLPAVAHDMLGALAQTLSPLALFAIGLRLAEPPLAGHTAPPTWLVALGVAYKLLLAPAVVWLLCRYVWPLPPQAQAVAVMQAGMGPMITSTLLALELGLCPPLVSRLLLWGLPLSGLSLALWWWIVAP